MIETTLGIHLDVPHDIGRCLTRVRRGATPYPGSQRLTPHLTLYLARFPASEFNALRAVLARRKLPQCRLSIIGPYTERLANGSVFVGARIRRTPTLMALHRIIVTTANRLRHGMLRTKDLTRLKQGYFSAHGSSIIRRYGYLRVLSNFVPHVTIGTVPSTRDLNRIKTAFKKSATRTWIAHGLIVGLYRYDTSRQRYETRCRKTRIPLQDRGA